ncbi:MAG: bifunctional diaminohydroxyphosphoribosylaminopyrimidine deaminase/5-amino-6-(5-phosphoribosylamino)uracil reductase RibD [Hyphomicrobiaceae bacterium]
MSAARDLRFMTLALRLAKRGLGTTAPNPSVGAVVADVGTGELIAYGQTRPGGRPHAETEALRKAGTRTAGATLYTTLEPCAHYGQTPPCAEAIIAAGIKRVVCATEDPDPRVAGRGLARLRAAGIEVETGLRADEARWIAAGHLLRIVEGRPFVQVKLAVDVNGLVPRAHAGRPVFVTGPEARAFAHLLRARADAIAIGRGTLEADDPQLTCRLPGLLWRSPVRVVLSGAMELPAGSNLARTAAASPVWLLCANDADTRPSGVPPAVVVHRVKRAAGGIGLDLGEALRRLAELGITRLLVEGGPTLASAFVDAELADECVVFKGAQGIGIEQGVRPFGGCGLERLHRSSQWQKMDERSIGADTLHLFRRI